MKFGWKSRGIATVLLCTGGWVTSADAAPGDHIRVGDAVITPSLSSGFEYHSNIYLADGSGSSTAVPGFSWGIAPRFDLDLDGPDVQMNMNFGWTPKFFIDPDPNDDFVLSNANKWTDLGAGLGIHALNRNLLGLRLDDKFEIINTPAELQTAAGGVNVNFIHLSNDLNGGVEIHPGSALQIGVLGNYGFDRYTVPDALVENSSLNNRSNYGPALDFRWKFLPKTSVIGMASVTWLRWDNNLIEAIGPEVDGVDYGEYLGKPNAMSWRTQWGLRGQLTDRIAATAEVGYGQMYYDEESVLEDAASQTDVVAGSSEELDTSGEESFARDLTGFGEGLTVNAQIAFAPIRGHTFTTGYRKDFQDAFFTNYVVYNYLFLRYEGLFATRFGLQGEITYRLDQFHGEVSRGDQNLKIKLNGAYRFNDWLSASVGGGWMERACIDDECEGGQFFATQYDDFYGQAGITLTY